jgi:elongation factor 1-gamma
LSEAYAIVQYLASNFCRSLNGNSAWEEAEVNQWVQFAHNEITRYNKTLLYPLLGFAEANPAQAQKDFNDVVQWVKVLNARLSGRTYLVGNGLTLADLEMFFALRFHFQMLFSEEVRSLFPHVTNWFSNLMVNENIVRCYGRTLLCKVAQVQFTVPQSEKLKLVGYKFSATVQRILAVAKFANAPVELENVNWGAPQREELRKNASTGTFPYLVTPNGVLSEAYAIVKYLLSTYNSSMLGNSAFERSQVNQWVEFSQQELMRHNKNVVYPILGFTQFNKEESDKSLKEVKEFLRIVNTQLTGKKYLTGSKLTVADLELFFVLRFYFTLVFAEDIRKNVFPNVTNWFVALAAEPQMVAAYGRTLLCKTPQKAAKVEAKKEEPKKAEVKKPAAAEKPAEEKKKGNPLDLLPPAKLVLDDFKREFLNSKDKPAVLKETFWPKYDANDYSLYYMKYDKLPTEGKILFRTKNSMSFFLQKLNDFRKYSFAAHGIYGTEGDYDIKGVWMWRGNGIPEEFRQHESFEYMMLRKLDASNEEDRKLVEEYWLNTDAEQTVEGIPVGYVETFR